MKRKKILYAVGMYTLLVLLLALFMFPIYMVLGMSLFTQSDMLEVPRRLAPSALNWRNFTDLFEVIGKYTDEYGREQGYLMWKYIANSLTVVVLYVVGCVLSSSVCAYAFAKVRFKGREIMFTVILMTMMIPGSVTIVPLYSIYKSLNMIDTLLPLWLPIWFGGGGVNIFLLRQFMRGFPDEVLESADIDGAGHLRKFFVLIVPSIIPSLLYVALTSALAVWNDFQTPLLYIYKREYWTLARGLAAMVTSNIVKPGFVTTEHLMFTACVIMCIFPLTLFIAGQKYFIESVSLTGLKG